MQLPQFVQQALQQLHAAGYEGYVVGGSVRDLVIGREPKDFDVTTNATPEQIQEVFDDTLYNNNFGTVVVRLFDDAIDENGEPIRHEVEITPYRAEADYSDGRHPDTIEFGVSLEEDLQRRDFTINAMAYNGEEIVDVYNGQEDAQARIIRTVGNAEERFTEDALRLLRACRFVAQLDFDIDIETEEAIVTLAPTIQKVSWERIRDEFMKIIASDNPYKGIWLMHKTGLLHEILPELSEGVDMEQNLHHIYTVFMHNVLALQYCPSEDPLVRLAALLHDVGKPRSKEGKGRDCTFHNHEHIGADMTRDIMKRFKFSKKDSERVEHLVRQHMFYYNPGELTDAAVRRLVKRIGWEHVDDLMAVRIGDRMGSGCQKEKPWKLVELERRMRDVSKDPMDTGMLKIDGNDMIAMGMKPGREIGIVLKAVLEDVLEDPSLNTKEYLMERATQIATESNYI